MLSGKKIDSREHSKSRFAERSSFTAEFEQNRIAEEVRDAAPLWYRLAHTTLRVGVVLLVLAVILSTRVVSDRLARMQAQAESEVPRAAASVASPPPSAEPLTSVEPVASVTPATSSKAVAFLPFAQTAPLKKATTTSGFVAVMPVASPSASVTSRPNTGPLFYPASLTSAVPDSNASSAR